MGECRRGPANARAATASDARLHPFAAPCRVTLPRERSCKPLSAGRLKSICLCNSEPAIMIQTKATARVPLVTVRRARHLASAMTGATQARVAHAGKDAPHVGVALRHAGHGIVGVDLVFEVDEARVFLRDECLEDGADGHFAVANSDLAPLSWKSVRSFMCMLKRRGPTSWMASTTSVPARTVCPTSMQQPMRGSMPLMSLRTSRGEGQSLSSGPWLWMARLMSYSLTNFSMRGRVSGDGIAGDDDLDAGALDVFEFAADVVVGGLLEVDGAGGMEVDAGGGVVGDGLGFGGRVHGEMVFRVLGVEFVEAQLLHEADHLGAGEVAEGVAGEAKAHGGFFCGRWVGERKAEERGRRRRRGHRRGRNCGERGWFPWSFFPEKRLRLGEANNAGPFDSRLNCFGAR